MILQGKGLRGGVAALLAFAALLLAACGGGGESSEPKAELKASADAAGAEVDEQKSPAKRAEPAGEIDRGRDAKAEPAAGSRGGAGSTAASGDESDRSSSGSRRNADENQAKPAPTKKQGKPKTPKQSSLPIPPQFAGKSIYQIAREMCADPNILEFVPEEQKENPEQLAEMARSFAPAGEEQEAYDGCLAGLHDIGL